MKGLQALKMLCVVIAGLFIMSHLAVAQSDVNSGLPWDGLIQLTATSVGAGVGLSWGSGTLTQSGKDYPLKIEGLNVGAVGISKATALGKVYNLKNVNDINGTYFAVGAGVALTGGGAGVTMKNAKGVVIDARATAEGVKFAMGTSGVTITIEQ